MNAAEGGGSRRLRILVIAYEFPPSPSPQSLRWAYLTGRLAGFGHEVHVMAPAIEGTDHGLPGREPRAEIHLVEPGPIRATLAKLEGWRARGKRDGKRGSGRASALGDPGPSARLNWKGRLREMFQDAVALAIFPDARGEWRSPAMRALPGLLERIRPDVVVASHEPATSLELGLAAKSLGYPWIADLADPVLAAYTPRHWRRRARSLEGTVMREADHILVTNAVVVDLLRQRHGGAVPMTVLPQGFDDAAEHPTCRGDGLAGPLDLFYSGSFYSFRDPRALVAAVVETEGVRLNIAAANTPAWLQEIARECPEKVVLLGQVPHRDVLSLQKRADVLVNLANADPSQVPGKFYEYLGAARPILHVRVDSADPAAALLTELGRGWVSSDDRVSLAGMLASLVRKHRLGCLEEALDLSGEPVAAWSWTLAARRLEGVLLAVAGSEEMAGEVVASARMTMQRGSENGEDRVE